MKPFERNVLTVVALFASNSSPLGRMRWDPRWATSSVAEPAAGVLSDEFGPLLSGKVRTKHPGFKPERSQTSTCPIHLGLVAWEDLL